MRWEVGETCNLKDWRTAAHHSPALTLPNGQKVMLINKTKFWMLCTLPRSTDIVGRQ